MDLSLERWEGSTPAEREAMVRRLASQLPSGFTFDAVRLCRLGEQQHHVALFKQGAATFALIPGGRVTLGYDANRPWEPNPDEAESWQETAEEYGLDQSLQEYIAAVTLRPRQVELAPFLVETIAREVGWEPLSLDDPEVREIVREHGTGTGVTVVRGDTSTRVHRGEDGELVAERSVAATHAELAAQLRASGFRFPT